MQDKDFYEQSLGLTALRSVTEINLQFCIASTLRD